jgi:hypothetical protein
MGRSGYCDDYDWDGAGAPPAFFEQAKTNAIKGKRGRGFLAELAAAMDSMPVKELIAEELVTADGACCTMGVVCKARGLDVSKVDYDDADAVGKLLGIAPTLAREIAYLNDDDFGYEATHKSGGIPGMSAETPAERWLRMRKWVSDQLGATQ